MRYPVNTPITYAATANTPGYSEGDHTVSWAFDDDTTDTGASVEKTWTTDGSHTATVTAVNDTTGGTATSAKTIELADYTLKAASGTPPDNKGIASAVLLDGTILSIGGLDRASSATTKLVYEYDGTTWTRVGDLNYERRIFGMTPVIYPTLADGRVMVFGNTLSTANTVEFYDPVTKTWSLGNTMYRSVSSYCKPVTLLDGRIFQPEGLAGGTGIGASQIYNPANDTWSTATGSGFTSEGQTAPVLLPDGRVFYGIYGSTRYRAYIFNPSTGALTNFAAPTQGIYSATLASNGLVYCASRNGNYFWKFDPSTNTFTALTAASALGSNGTELKTLDNGRYLVLFGIGTALGDNGYITFDTVSETWSNPIISPVLNFLDDAQYTAYAKTGKIWFLWGNLNPPKTYYFDGD